MTSLAELFNKYGSDKDRNGYTPIYQSLFKNLREKQLNILEIGVGCTYLMGKEYTPGASLKAWGEYFPRSRVYSIDIDPESINLSFLEGRVTTHYCNSTNLESVRIFMDTIAVQKFDIIIDDGSHLKQDQLTTLKHFIPYLETGGYYILEDIGGDTRNLGYASCPEFHPPRLLVKEIIGSRHVYVVQDFPQHQSAVMVISD